MNAKTCLSDRRSWHAMTRSSERRWAAAVREQLRVASRSPKPLKPQKRQALKHLNPRNLRRLQALDQAEASAEGEVTGGSDIFSLGLAL